MKYIIWISSFVVLSACSYTTASKHSTDVQQSQATNQAVSNMDHKKRFFVARKGIEDGYVFTFHIMPAPLGEGYSRSLYHLMVSVEQNNKALTDLVLSSRVKHPDGKVEENSAMMLMGDWYMSLYNLDHEQGRHWITVSFKQAGKTYSTGIYYPERAYRQ